MDRVRGDSDHDVSDDVQRNDNSTDAHGLSALVEIGGEAGTFRRANSATKSNKAALLQGAALVLQNRRMEGKGPLPPTSLEDEFKVTRKVPFILQRAGGYEAVSFVSK